jgi:SAM-dependent methyltransferase
MLVEDSSKGDYYTKRVINGDTSIESFFNQVGKTYLGKPIKRKEFDILVQNILKSLNIAKIDEVLDLGSGNGLITYRISEYAHNIIGFDINKELLGVADKNHKKNNIEYIKQNILDIDFSKYKGNKLYMYAVLQYIDYKDFRRLLQKLVRQKINFDLFIGDIPDIEKQLNFYHTPERKKYLFTELIENKKIHLGYWWYRDHILQISKDLDLDIEILDQDPMLSTSHYRFDVMITKKLF